MKKCSLLLLFTAIFISGCSLNKKQEETSISRDDPSILIAYFSWGENAEAFDSSEIDVDATTSASLSLPGNVVKMASEIGERVEAETFRILVKDRYPSDYDECLERASEEKVTSMRPELIDRVSDINKYDVIFLGYPDWWSTAPMAIFTFIEENDLANKEVILFCSHGTSGLGSSVTDISKVLPNSTTINDNVLGVAREEIEQSEKMVISWLDDLGF
ncbi:hypothetical protein KZR47_000969 [Enterococcus faecalis]|uniref:flavodoxin n=1 Tax=Enterococcus faecalis TaxID=1351 RepID=UPI0001F0C751|nr:flavodoxin [Enterococcus faecalis]EFT95193.1 hypothetical protein HMPREF9499_00636 [Enterococcus faecalis TX0012]EHU8539389.1 hypothetical protein [Enterococcus faecalis]